MPPKEFTSPKGNTIRALIIASASLLQPGHGVANIPDATPRSGMTEQSGNITPEFQDRIYLGSQNTIAQSYQNYPTAQVRRIVTTFLNALADKYDVRASAPPVPSAADACMAATGRITPEIEEGQALRQTADFFRDIARTTSNPEIHPEIARSFAISVLHSLSPFLPAEISNPDQTPVHNPAATDPGGVILRLASRDFFTTMNAGENFVGTMERRDHAAPEATVLGNLPHERSLRDNIKVLERILDLGGSLVEYYRARQSLPRLVIMAHTPEGHQSMILERMPNAPAPRRNCATQPML